jgi:hypothetical protein
MDEAAFRTFLKRGGRTLSMAQQVVTLVQRFASYLQTERGGRGLDEARPEDLEAYVAWVEREPRASAKGHLHAIAYYYEHTANEELRALAGLLRGARIERPPFPLRDFRGVDPEHVERLAALGIRNARQMLEAGRTPAGRQELAARTGIPGQAILELVKLSDLARIFGVKGIRARLYLDAGVDTPEKIAGYDAEEFRALIVGFVARTGFEGVATLPAEARFTVEYARKLPRLVEYD